MTHPTKSPSVEKGKKFHEEMRWTVKSSTDWLDSNMREVVRSFKFDGKWYTVTVKRGKHL